MEGWKRLSIKTGGGLMPARSFVDPDPCDRKSQGLLESSQEDLSSRYLDYLTHATLDCFLPARYLSFRYPPSQSRLVKGVEIEKGIEGRGLEWEIGSYTKAHIYSHGADALVPLPTSPPLPAPPLCNAMLPSPSSTGTRSLTFFPPLPLRPINPKLKGP
jgi:hypothetical protein